jgi:hypothetical protein
MSEIHALLVGIDRYEPERFADDRPILPLQGCVQDVRRMEQLLLSDPIAIPPERIRKLVSPHVQVDGGPVAGGNLPTREALVREIRGLGERARPGDAVLIHYSGHGTRVRTSLPDVKGASAWDECLVPCDVATAGVLRDVEIHALACELAEKDLLVTWVLDACHSGGAFRDLGAGPLTHVGGERVRTLGDLPPSLADPGGLAVGREVAEELWPAPSSLFRNVLPGSGWFPQPRGSALLAACCPHEVAREVAFPGIGPSGALTHFLLEIMGAPRPPVSLRELHQRLLSRMHAWCSRQTPVVEGDWERSLLGRPPEARPKPWGWRVLDVRGQAPPQVVVGGGWFHAIRAGARLGLHPPRADAAEPDAISTGSAEVVESGPTVSYARLADLPAESAPVGSLLYLEDLGPCARSWTVKIPSGAASADVKARLETLRSQLPRRLPIRLEAVADGEDADFCIGIEGGASLVVQDGRGTTLPLQGGGIAAGDPEAADRLLHRLEHLGRFSEARGLTRVAGSSPLRDRLHAELFRVPAGALPGDPTIRRGLTGPAEPDEHLHLVLTNTSRSDLSVAVLDLQPDWGINRVHPGAGQGDWDLLERESELVVLLLADLPPGLEAGRDLLLVFAATGALDVSPLELPPLDPALAEAMPAGPQGGRPADAFRTVRRPPEAAEPWAIAWVDLEVARKGSSSDQLGLSGKAAGGAHSGRPS